MIVPDDDKPVKPVSVPVAIRLLPCAVKAILPAELMTTLPVLLPPRVSVPALVVARLPVPVKNVALFPLFALILAVGVPVLLLMKANLALAVLVPPTSKSKVLLNGSTVPLFNWKKFVPRLVALVHVGLAPAPLVVKTYPDVPGASAANVPAAEKYGILPCAVAEKSCPVPPLTGLSCPVIYDAPIVPRLTALLLRTPALLCTIPVPSPKLTVLLAESVVNAPVLGVVAPIAVPLIPVVVVLKLLEVKVNALAPVLIDDALSPERVSVPLVAVRLRAPLVRVNPLLAVRSPALVMVPEPVVEILPLVVTASPAVVGDRLDPVLVQ